MSDLETSPGFCEYVSIRQKFRLNVLSYQNQIVPSKSVMNPLFTAVRPSEALRTYGVNSVSWHSVTEGADQLGRPTAVCPTLPSVLLDIPHESDLLQGSCKTEHHRESINVVYSYHFLLKLTL